MHSIFYKIWASVASNFGGKPFPSKIDHIASYKTLVFAFMVDGVVLWVSYQSFLYTELSTPLIKNPFNDLESLAKSDYMWVLELTPCTNLFKQWSKSIRVVLVYEWYFLYLLRLYTGPKDTYRLEVLSSPAYKKVMEKNVNLELSFNDWSISEEKTLKEPKRAYFAEFNEAKLAKNQVILKFW